MFWFSPTLWVTARSSSRYAVDVIKDGPVVKGVIFESKSGRRGVRGALGLFCGGSYVPSKKYKAFFMSEFAFFLVGD